MGRRKKTAPVKKTGGRFKLHIYATPYVHASDIVPKSWHSWFWDLISENAPFSWGDNDVSLITSDSFLNYCQKILVPREIDEESPISGQDIDDFYRRLRLLGNLMVDFECKLFMT